MGTSPYLAAVETLRRCQQGLAGAVTSDERDRLLELHEQALQLLEQSAQRRRLSTAALADRVAQLEHQLADWPPDERAAAIRGRLGLSKSRYYELRAESGYSRTGE